MAEDPIEKKPEEVIFKKFELKIDPKKDSQGNDIRGNEGPMISGDSTWKKRLEIIDEED